MARRIVLPVLLLIAGLFALLAVIAVRVAGGQADEEIAVRADRLAAALAVSPVPPERRDDILPALAALVGAEVAVDGYATEASWSDADIAALAPGEAALDDGYRVLERRAPGGRRYLVLFDLPSIRARERALLQPILVTGGLGLLVAAVVGLLVAGTIARPVRGLAEQTRRFARGEWDGEAGGRGPGEIGELQDAFARMVEALRESEARLRESERFAALGRLAGGIAHELRNPLTAIRMAVETATAGEDGSRAEARRVALGEIDRLDRTLRELLDFVRPRRPDKTDVALGDLFREVDALLGPQCAHLGVELRVGDPGAARVRADRDRLKQALLNLVLNAAQAQPGGGAVHVRAVPGGVEVRDEGPGIAEEVRGTLLQPFVTTKAAGIGLGLAVVKQVADEHGGDLAFRTGPEGATFTLRVES